MAAAMPTAAEARSAGHAVRGALVCVNTSAGNINGITHAPQTTLQMAVTMDGPSQLPMDTPAQQRVATRQLRVIGGLPAVSPGEPEAMEADAWERALPLLAARRLRLPLLGRLSRRGLLSQSGLAAPS